MMEREKKRSRESIRFKKAQVFPSDCYAIDQKERCRRS